MIIIKLIISFLIVALAGYIGIQKAGGLSKREYILRDMIKFLKNVKNEIVYMQTILPNAFEIARQNVYFELKDAIGQIIIDMLNQKSDYIKDESIVVNISRIKNLTDYDKNVFISIIKSLGRGDVTTQINIIDNGINTLENQVKEANEYKLSNAKVYKKMGFIMGLIIVIIFI